MVKLLEGAKPWMFAYLTDEDFDEAIDYALTHDHAILRIDLKGLSDHSIGRFLSDARIPLLQRVHVVSGGESLSSLAHFTGLKGISFAIPVDEFEFSIFHHLQEVGGVWTDGWRGLDKCPELCRFRVSKFRGSIGDIPNLARMERIDLIQTTITSLSGLERAETLKVLEISYAARLRSIHALSGTGKTLERLILDRCKNIDGVEVLRSLSNVTWLSITECGHISAIDFLKGMSRLNAFVTIGTKILSGDLTPILNNPSIRYVVLDNARDYHPKLSVVLEAVRARSGA